MSGRRVGLSALFTWRSAISSPESGLTPLEHHVALTLSLHMNELGGSAFPSIFPTLHEESCGRSPAAIRDALNQLVRLGWLERVARVGRGRSSEYSSRIPPWWETHRREADYDASVADRRAAALRAAEAFLQPFEAFSEGDSAPQENRLMQAGSGGEGETCLSEPETRLMDLGNPPASGAEDVRRSTGGRRAATSPGEKGDDPDPRLLAMRLVREPVTRSWLRGPGSVLADSARDFADEASKTLGARNRELVEEFRQFAAAETPLQAYRRWIEETPDLPLAEVSAVVASWEDLDDVDRQELLDRAEAIRAVEQPAKPRKAAAA